MAFESGISQYMHARMTVDVYFPVDERGNEYIACERCKLYNANTRRCTDTGEIIPFPGKFVGNECRLQEVKEDNDEH